MQRGSVRPHRSLVIAVCVALTGCGGNGSNGPITSMDLSERSVAETQPATTSVPTSAPATTTTLASRVVAIEGLGSGPLVYLTGGQVNYPPIAALGSLWIPVTDEAKVVRLDLATGELLAEIAAGRRVRPCCGANALAFGGGLIWVAQARDQAVLVIDPAVNEVIDTIPLGIDLYDLVSDGSSVWVTSFEAGNVTRIDIESREVIAIVEGVSNPTAVLSGGGAIWVVEHRRGNLIRIDPTTNSIAATIELGAVEGRTAGGENAVVAFGGVWVATNNGRTVVRVDMVTNEQTVIEFPATNTMRVTASERGIWVVYASEGPETADFAYIDASTLEVSSFAFHEPWIPFENDGVMWLVGLHPSGDQIWRIELGG